MTKQIKLLSVIGIAALLLVGFGVFAITQQNEEVIQTNDTFQVAEEQVENNNEESTEQADESEVVNNSLTEQEETNPTVQEANNNETEVSSNNELQENNQVVARQYETYTNEYFPDFELVYPGDWNVEYFNATNLPGNQYFYHEFILNSEDTSLTFLLNPEPIRGFGCQQFDDWEYLNKVNSLYQYKKVNADEYSYSDRNVPLCPSSSKLQSTFVNDPEIAKNNNITTDNNGISQYNVSIVSKGADQEAVANILQKSTF